MKPNPASSSFSADIAGERWDIRWLPVALSGDEIELVVFDVDKGRPPRVVTLDVAGLSGPETYEAFRLGLEAVAYEIEMKSVLDDFRFGHAMKCQAWSGYGLVPSEENGVFGGGAICDLPAEDSAPKSRHCGGVGAVDGYTQDGVCHSVSPSRVGGRPRETVSTAGVRSGRGQTPVAK
jgi:hypothetical protein